MVCIEGVVCLQQLLARLLDASSATAEVQEKIADFECGLIEADRLPRIGRIQQQPLAICLAQHYSGEGGIKFTLGNP